MRSHAWRDSRHCTSSPGHCDPAEGPEAAYDAAVRAALEWGGVVVPGGARGPPSQELGAGLSIGRPAGDAPSLLSLIIRAALVGADRESHGWLVPAGVQPPCDVHPALRPGVGVRRRG